MIGTKNWINSFKGMSLFSWWAILFYTVGGLGMILNEELFIPLSALNLLLMMLLLFFDEVSITKLLLFIVVGVAGWLMEWVGVHTGMPFGIYEYGDGLGWKWKDIPLIIAANWIMITWLGVATARWVMPSASRWGIAWLSAILMVIMDVLMEPVAPHLDYWMFQLNRVPMQNYLAWGWLGLMFSWLFTFISPSKNYFPVMLAFIQWVFFIALNLYY
jgi:putative membrane protein